MRNQLQQERTRQFFLDAAVQIIKTEGPSGISTRNVAARAGYSYATLYNYFKDIDDLVFACIDGFCSECRDFVLSEAHSAESGRERIKAVCRAFAKFFLQNPGIFELVFIYKIRDQFMPTEPAHRISSLLAELITPEFQAITKIDGTNDLAADKIQIQLLCGITGMLLLFLNRRFPGSFSEFVAGLDDFLDRLL